MNNNSLKHPHKSAFQLSPLYKNCIIAQNKAIKKHSASELHKGNTYNIYTIKIIVLSMQWQPVGLYEPDKRNKRTTLATSLYCQS